MAYYKCVENVQIEFPDKIFCEKFDSSVDLMHGILLIRAIFPIHPIHSYIWLTIGKLWTIIYWFAQYIQTANQCIRFLRRSASANYYYPGTTRMINNSCFSLRFLSNLTELRIQHFSLPNTFYSQILTKYCSAELLLIIIS